MLDTLKEMFVPRHDRIPDNTYVNRSNTKSHFKNWKAFLNLRPAVIVHYEVTICQLP